MQIKLQNQNLSLKFLTPLFLVVCYWFYLSICFGYFSSKIFFNFFDEINKNDLSKSIQFRKKFSLKNIIKIIIDFFRKLIKNWFIRIRDKFLFLIAAINKVIKALKICRKKFKSILKFKHNFRLLKNLLPIFWETFLIFCSFMNEISFLHNIIEWIIQLMNFIRLLMKESLFIIRIVYFLYFILLGIFGITIGFLLGTYKVDDEINTVLLLLLLKIIYNNRFDDVLLEYLHDLSLEINTAETFSKFSLKSIEQIDPRPLKITLKEPEQISLPFLIIEDPLVFIDKEVLWDESTNYQFELFKFYRYVNQKI
uniref:hypothetical protein n=1 Tax=Pleurosigma intermedium TaxID=197753 RepID=UPI0021822C69|nr:hypothetical protein N4L43_pgp006 [Pleurosigma intermedium]UVG41943.1 hypothetical protein [Pleurosigma intermedium]